MLVTTHILTFARQSVKHDSVPVLKSVLKRSIYSAAFAMTNQVTQWKVLGSQLFHPSNHRMLQWTFC